MEDISPSRIFTTILSPLFIERGFEFKSSTNKFIKKKDNDNISIEFRFSHSFGLISLKEVSVMITYNSLKKELLNVFNDYYNDNNLEKKLINKRHYHFWFDEGLNHVIKGTLREPLLEYYDKDDYSIASEKFITILYPQIMEFVDFYFPLSNFISTLKNFAYNKISDKRAYYKLEYLIQYFVSEKYLTKTEQKNLWSQYLQDERKASREFYPDFINDMKNVFSKSNIQPDD